jgi:serine protease
MPEWWGQDTIRCTDQWHLQLAQVDKAWNIEKGDSTITIAILDSGVDYFHPDLRENIWVNPGEDLDGDRAVWDMDDINGEDDDDNGLVDDLIGYDFYYDDNDPDPYFQGDTTFYAHGTMMASVCAVTNNDDPDTSIAGFAWNCKIVPLRGPGFGTSAGVQSVTAALNYCASMEIDIANMSFGYYGGASFEEAVKNADSLGVVLIASAGSDNLVLVYPASFDEVMKVSVVDHTGKKIVGKEYGDDVEVCGLGSQDFGPRQMMITSFGYYGNYCPGSDYPHAYYPTPGHTSYASAQASALAGLLRSIYPDSSNTFIKNEIQRGAIPVDTAQGNIGEPWQYLLGAGRINAYRSMTRWGRIRNDTTWTKFAYVSADMKVDDGVTVTIEPGTIIYVAPDDNDDFGVDSARIVLEVWGTLNINGTPENPVEIKSLSESPQPGDWYGIWFKGTSSSGTIKNCKIYDAKYGT